MENLLFVRTFLIIGGMLLITAYASKVNRRFETFFEMITTIIVTFIVIPFLSYYGNIYPWNLILVVIFSFLIGWQIGPTIEYIGIEFKLRKFKKDYNIKLKKGESLSSEQKQKFEEIFKIKKYTKEWDIIVSRALIGTAIAIITTACVVYFSNVQFSFLGNFLLTSLLILISMSVINIFFLKSSVLSLFESYLWTGLFILYLLYDFDKLEKMATNTSWGTAIDIATNIYLDIINLFINLLHIISKTS